MLAKCKSAIPEEMRHERDREDDNFDNPISLQWLAAWECAEIVAMLLYESFNK